MTTKSKLSKFTIPGLMVLTLIISACTSQYNRVGFQGRLTDASGVPLNGTYQIGVQYWTCSAGTGLGCTSRYNQAASAVTVTNGVFDMSIGVETFPTSGGPDPAIYSQPLWAEVTVNGETLTPRIPLKGAPYAMGLIGGAVMSSGHTNEADGQNYATLTVTSVDAGATSLLVVGASNATTQLIRACSIASLPATRADSCPDAEFIVYGDGNVRADGSFASPAADFAEQIQVDGVAARLQPGDVLVISDSQDRAVELSTKPYATSVLGVYSTKPAFIGGSEIDGGSSGTVPVAFVGIVPVKVTAANGPIHRGDLLTTSALRGHAMLATEYVPGAILGKAMGELKTGTGVIDVALIIR